MRLRRIALAVAVCVFAAVPAAVALTADPFGPVEVADPTYRPGVFFNGTPFVGADGAGNVLLATTFRDPRSDDQLAVYERCGAGPVGWQRTVLTTATGGVESMSLRVARNGTAMAVWAVREGGTTKHFSRTRPPGGVWGDPQLIVADSGVGLVQIALSDSGDAVAAWADSSPAGTSASVRPAGGTWETPVVLTSSTLWPRVAMSATGDALVAYRGPTPGYVFARFKPAGGAWGGEAEVLRDNFQDELQDLMVEFDGTGRAVAVGKFRELTETVRANVRGAGSAGTWTPSAEWEKSALDDDGANPPNPSYGTRRLEGLVRHPNGAVAVWTRRAGQATDDVVVARLSAAGWETPVVFDVPNSFNNASAAVNDAGEILLAGALNYTPGTIEVSEIRGTIAPSITGPWPGMTLLSPPGSTATQYRDVVTAGGGPAFAVGWGVHGPGNDRTEVISTKPAGAACAGTSTPTSTPTPTPTAGATATPDPAPNPLPLPSPTPPPPATPAPPSAIADFTTLPAASKCVRGRKLTIKFKTPPKGYVVKTVAVKVNAKKAATVKGSKLKKPLYLRRLPKGSFTITVSITLTKGKGLTEKRRYTACK